MGAEPTATLAVTGRFQPFHRDHLALVADALGAAARVIIGITNPDRRSLRPTAASPHRHRPDANPFTYFERLGIIRAALEGDGVPAPRYEIVPFPLDEPAVWAGYIPADAVQLVRVFSDWEREKARRLEAGGYRVRVIVGDPARRISASDIRAAMAAGEPWQHWLPPGAVAALEEFGADELRRRCAGLERSA